MLPSQVVDASYDFVAKNQNLVRSLPLWAGGLGFVCLLANRTLSGVRMVLWTIHYLCMLHFASDTGGCTISGIC